MTLGFDVRTGERIWPKANVELLVDAFGDCREGPFAGIPADGSSVLLYELPSGDFAVRTPPNTFCIGSRRILASGGPRRVGDQDVGRTVYRLGQDEPIITLGIDDRWSGAWTQWSRDEMHLAWGHTNGTVHLANLPEVQQVLAQDGLGW